MSCHHRQCAECARNCLPHPDREWGPGAGDLALWADQVRLPRQGRQVLRASVTCCHRLCRPAPVFPPDLQRLQAVWQCLRGSAVRRIDPYWHWQGLPVRHGFVLQRRARPWRFLPEVRVRNREQPPRFSDCPDGTVASRFPDQGPELTRSGPHLSGLGTGQ